MKRRKFIEQTSLFSASLLFSSFISDVTKKSNPTILLVSGWQDVNIGDFGHTQRLLHVLSKSIEHLKKAGIVGNHVQFAPDATFFINIRDDKKSFDFLKTNGLEDKNLFLPYHGYVTRLTIN